MKIVKCLSNCCTEWCRK